MRNFLGSAEVGMGYNNVYCIKSLALCVYIYCMKRGGYNRGRHYGIPFVGSIIKRFFHMKGHRDFLYLKRLQDNVLIRIGPMNGRTNRNFSYEHRDYAHFIYTMAGFN